MRETRSIGYKRILALPILLACCLSTGAHDGAATVEKKDWQDFSTLVCGGLMAAESTLLLTFVNHPSGTSWSSLKNDGLAIADIVGGGVLAYFALSRGDYSGEWLYYAVSALLFATHAYRDFEYVARSPNPFLKNPTLLVFNNIRIGLLGTSLLLTINI